MAVPGLCIVRHAVPETANPNPHALQVVPTCSAQPASEEETVMTDDILLRERITDAVQKHIMACYEAHEGMTAESVADAVLSVLIGGEGAQDNGISPDPLCSCGHHSSAHSAKNEYQCVWCRCDGFNPAFPVVTGEQVNVNSVLMRE